MKRFTVFGATAALIAATTLCTAVQAQEYPSRPIRFIVPFAPGGTSEMVGRLVGAKVSEDLGQSVVIDSRGGAGATIGTRLAAMATPDGYTIIVSHIGLAINETLYPKRNYNAARDLTAVSLIGATPSALVVNNDLPVRNVKDFIALAKAQPGKLAYGSAGIGSTSHLSVELLQDLAKVTFNHIPYRGGAPAMTDLISGQVQFAIPTLPLVVGHAKAGRLRMIATTGAKRFPAMPDVPTVAEAGIPGGYSYTTWYGIFAPAATTKLVIARLNQAVVMALGTTDLREKLVLEGLEPESSTAEYLNNLLRADIKKWAKIIKAAGIEPR